MKKIFIAAGILILILGCTGSVKSGSAVQNCIELCRSYKGNLSNGPCLSNEVAPGWVCDVAHSPRLDIDNLPENQCEAYRNGTATHFVEVDENCELIRAI